MGFSFKEGRFGKIGTDGSVRRKPSYPVLFLTEGKRRVKQNFPENRHPELEKFAL
jgi:hypothetical protein